ncbi:MAG: hypothetical protein JJU12_04705 [Chlamydiales bacterium]|nr:hypothetical protein [Chlamydiales bacterium]
MYNIPQLAKRYFQVSLPDQIKKAPWLDIGLVVGAVALTTIGLLTHFHVLHHIGSLSQDAIQKGAIGGVVGLVFLEASQRLFRNFCLKKKIEPVDFKKLDEPKPFNFEFKNYTVRGSIPENIHERLEEAIRKAIEGEEADKKNAIKKVVYQQEIEQGWILAEEKSENKSETIFFEKYYKGFASYLYAFWGYGYQEPTYIYFFNLPELIKTKIKDSQINIRPGELREGATLSILPLENKEVISFLDMAFKETNCSETVFLQIGNEEPVTVRYKKGKRA